MARRSLKAFVKGLEAQIAQADAEVQQCTSALQAASEKRDALKAILEMPELQQAKGKGK